MWSCIRYIYIILYVVFWRVEKVGQTDFILPFYPFANIISKPVTIIIINFINTSRVNDIVLLQSFFFFFCNIINEGLIRKFFYFFLVNIFTRRPLRGFRHERRMRFLLFISRECYHVNDGHVPFHIKKIMY